MKALTSKIQLFFAQRRIRQAGLFLSASILFTTTALWSYLGASVQNYNADQLVDPYLFTSWDTFHDAIFPAAHSMLIKWPLFWGVALTGVTKISLIAWTVGLCLITVIGLAFLLAKIERRPERLAILYLVLSVILLLVPAQAYPGGLLPVNMAMLTTRNIEYLIFIGGLWLITTSKAMVSIRAIIAAVVFGLLFSSDQLFFYMGLGGAVVMILCTLVMRHWGLMKISLRWFMAVLVGAILGKLIVMGINASGLTTIASGNQAGPYDLNTSVNSLVIATFYAVLHVLTNLGANPAYDVIIAKDVPLAYIRRLGDYPGLVYGFGVLLAGLLVVTVAKLITKLAQNRMGRPNAADTLGITLVVTSFVACGLFVISNHYFAVDARYLSIILFAAIVIVATMMRSRSFRPMLGLATAIFLVAAVVPATQLAYVRHDKEVAAQKAFDRRNEYVAHALDKYKIDTLVGDYWRVLPTRLASSKRLTVTPLADCMTKRDVLTSRTWEPDLSRKPFAYLLPLEKGQTDFPSCRADEVIKQYGRPNATLTIAGSLDQPQEQLLIYTGGTNNAPKTPSKYTPKPASAILPLELSKLPDMSCRDRPTIMSFVAHQDDDILFMNPDLIKSLDAKECVRAVYLTAGDAGADKLYWLGRRLGSQAAYESMTGAKYTWVERVVKTETGQYVTLMTPRENRSITLVFINLPDGNVNGRGFSAYKNQSLAKLEDGSIRDMTTVDGQSTYTLPALTGTLEQLMRVYKPSEVRTQSTVIGGQYRDHSDHIATSRITSQALGAYNNDIPLVRYIGYPIHGNAQNVFGDILARKQAAFLAYGRYDGGVCHDLETCRGSSAYGAYLTRQYVQE